MSRVLIDVSYQRDVENRYFEWGRRHRDSAAIVSVTTMPPVDGPWLDNTVGMILPEDFIEEVLEEASIPYRRG